MVPGPPTEVLVPGTPHLYGLPRTFQPEHLRPGVRLLTIVGASHAGYHKAYLAMMHDVRLADTGVVLR